MRETIDNRVYDTENATKVAEVTYTVGGKQFLEVLYRKTIGEYFLHLVTLKMLQPTAYADARVWMLKYHNIDLNDNPSYTDKAVRPKTDRKIRRNLSISVSIDVDAVVRSHAAKMGVTVSEFVSSAIMNYAYEIDELDDMAKDT